MFSQKYNNNITIAINLLHNELKTDTYVWAMENKPEALVTMTISMSEYSRLMEKDKLITIDAIDSMKYNHCVYNFEGKYVSFNKDAVVADMIQRMERDTRQEESERHNIGDRVKEGLIEDLYRQIQLIKSKWWYKIFAGLERISKLSYWYAKRKINAR